MSPSSDSPADVASAPTDLRKTTGIAARSAMQAATGISLAGDMATRRQAPASILPTADRSSGGAWLFRRLPTFAAMRLAS